jgi:predicted GH43/DUF377 family glycosyl hydrolase
MLYGAVKGDFSDTDTVRIFQSTSTDGIQWTRDHEPVLLPGPKGSWDSVAVETPYLIRHPQKQEYWMYYSGTKKQDGNLWYQIGLATSTDGRHWSKDPQNPVFGFHSTTTKYLSFIDPCVLYKDGTFWLWYVVITTQYKIEIGLAKSPDGVHWEDKGIVLKRDVETRDNDDTGVGEPSVVWNDEAFEIFYSVLPKKSHSSVSIWRATSTDGMAWVKDHGPVLIRGSKGHWTESGVSSPAVICENGRYRLWFGGDRTDRKSYYSIGIGLAEPK